MMFVSIGIGTVVAIALITVVSLLTGGKVNDNATVQNALVGKSVRGFSLSGLSGGTVRSPWSSGHPGVLIFFASWCGPCKAEMPKIAKYLATHGEGSIQVLGIDTGDQRGAGQAFVRRAGATFRVGFDPSSSIASGTFGFQGIPETVFLNAKGTVVEVYPGAIPKDQLIKGLETLRAT